MKKSKLLLLLAAPLLLTGCKFLPGGSSAAPSGESGSSGSSGSEESGAHTSLQIADDFAAALSEAAGSEITYDDAGSGAYRFYMYLDDTDEEAYPNDADEDLLWELTGVLNYLPEYLDTDSASYWFFDGTSSDPEHSYWEDDSGDTTLAFWIPNEDGSVMVEALFYCYEGDPIAQVWVAPYSA